MKSFKLKIKVSRKETKDERKLRVQNDTANRSAVFENKKKYKRCRDKKIPADY